MVKSLVLSMLIAIPLIGQTLTNHSEKLTIKRKVFNLSSYADFDFRTTNERGFYYRHLDIGVNFPLAKTWSTSVQYRNIIQKRMGNGSLKNDLKP